MTAPPLPFLWDGEAMVPRHPRIADRHFVIGQVYTLEPREDRSPESHRHYFAVINEAWKNLPEEAAERLPTPEHLRKFALIRTGYRDERSIACSSKAEAQRVAAFIRPMDDFSIVAVSGSTVTVWTAKSQSQKAMGKKDFQESKDKVLDYVASLIGVKAADLAKQGEAA